MMTPVADHTVYQYDRLKTVGSAERLDEFCGDGVYLHCHVEAFRTYCSRDDGYVPHSNSEAATPTDTNVELCLHKNFDLFT